MSAHSEIQMKQTVLVLKKWITSRALSCAARKQLTVKMFQSTFHGSFLTSVSRWSTVVFTDSQLSSMPVLQAAQSLLCRDRNGRGRARLAFEARKTQHKLKAHPGGPFAAPPRKPPSIPPVLRQQQRYLTEAFVACAAMFT